jgi:hypothetical protein
MKKLMESDIKAIKAWNQFKASAAGGNSTMTDEYDWDCEYVEYSTVPDQIGGAFWSILNRIFIGMSPTHRFLPSIRELLDQADNSIRVPTPHSVRDGRPQTTL